MVDEIFLLKEDNNCIVKIYCSFQDEEHMYLIMKYLTSGGMMTLFMKKDTLKEDEARFYVGQQLLAIESDLKNNYIHRYGHKKLSDFGYDTIGLQLSTHST
jgi:serine/threonine kinase 38